MTSTAPCLTEPCLKEQRTLSRQRCTAGGRGTEGGEFPVDAVLEGESVSSPSPLCSASNLTNTFLERERGCQEREGGREGGRPGLREEGVVDILFLHPQVQSVCLDELVWQLVGGGDVFLCPPEN